MDEPYDFQNDSAGEPETAAVVHIRQNFDYLVNFRYKSYMVTAPETSTTFVESGDSDVIGDRND